MAKKSSLRERLKEQREKIANKGGNYTTFIFPKPGVYRMRHVPVGEEADWALEIVGFFLGKDIGFIISPKTFGGKCALYNKYEALKNSEDKDDQDWAKKLKPKVRFASLAYRYKDEKGKEVDYDAGVKPVLLFPDQYQDMIDLFLDDGEAGDFTDPRNGYDLKHKREGTGQYDTEYSTTQCKPTPCDKKFRGPYDLEAEVKKLVATYEQTKEYLKKFLSTASDDEQQQPSKKSSSKDRDKAKSKKKKGGRGDM